MCLTTEYQDIVGTSTENSMDPQHHITLTITKSPQVGELQGFGSQSSRIYGSTNASEIIIFGKERAHQ